MENLEEDTQESIVTTMAASVSATDLASSLVPVVDNLVSLPQENADDSVIFIHPHMELVDLTSPTQQQPEQPSASTSAGAGAATNSGGLLGPLTFDEPSCSKDTLKDSTCLTASSTIDNPSSSPSGSSAGASLTTAAAAAIAAVGVASATASTTSVLECPICLQTCIHPARLPCGHIFCFLCVKGVAYKNRRCAMCRREIPPEFLDHPQLVNGIEDICTTKATDDGYQWFYEGRNGGWWAYELRTALEIEEVFQNLHNKTQTQTQANEEKKGEQQKHPQQHTDSSVQNNEIEISDGEVNDNDDEGEGVDEQEDKINADGQIIDQPSHIYNILICGSMYVLDFKQMIQYPQHMPYRKRKICRAKGLPAKGVAGLLNSRRRGRNYNNQRTRPY